MDARCQLLAVVLLIAVPATAAEDPFAWPVATRETRPWSYWWWPGSAVDPANLTRELERYRRAGWGGVHVIPIYGARGAESRFIDYLSPRWMAMLRHTVSEGNRLDLGVDMTTGTGWCFGGPNIPEAQASAVAVVKIAEGAYTVSQRPTSRVKRAAPGGEGHMLNPLYGPAIRTYLKRFTEAFATYDGPRPRAMYHDSFEYAVDWSPDLLEQFERRRGYRLQDEFPVFFGNQETDRAARVKSDYRETIADVMDEDFIRVWVDWCRRQGMRTRNQAHGSPGNLLDLYAEADIPETEMFNRDRSSLVSKFASSAAHVAGRKLVASETGTWLKEHFNETLGDLKELADQLFLSGVNHVIYHGTCYSPDDAAWPGWLFYASTEMNPRNAIWRDVPALNAYVTRCQSLLQHGRPDNDILLYWPVYDVWHDPKGTALKFTVHNRGWIEGQTFGKLAQSLLDRGYAFDLISDRQLEAAQAANGVVRVPGGPYRAVVAPATDHMPVTTLRRLLDLARAGATVVFEERLPADVPGLGDLENRRARFSELLASVTLWDAAPGVTEARAGRGRILAGNPEACLASAGVRRETLTDRAGLQFLRRASEAGTFYFLANRGAQAVEGWVPLAASADSAVILDPMTGRGGRGATRKTRGGIEVYLQLAPLESVFVRTRRGRTGGAAWKYWTPAQSSVALNGAWSVRFLEGGPELPPPFRTSRLASWTQTSGEAGRRFAGAALYSIRCPRPAGPAEAWFLELGKVCESARVRLNGRDLGAVFLPPFRWLVEDLKPKGNLLEIEVTNLAANRIRDLDRRKVPWKIFYDINFVGLDYKPLDASSWPLRDSGLLGPVTWRALQQAAPSLSSPGRAAVAISASARPDPVIAHGP